MTLNDVLTAMRQCPTTVATHPATNVTLTVCIVDPIIIKGWADVIEREVAELKKKLEKVEL